MLVGLFSKVRWQIYEKEKNMKRTGYLYEEIYELENLKTAHRNARKDKLFYEEVKMIDDNEWYYLREIQSMLREERYKTSEYSVFYKTDYGKTRKIYKLPYYPDRIAQWALIQVISPYILFRLTDDTYSAVPGMGSHRCLRNVKRAMVNDMKGCKYCLKFDIKHYYQTIDHEILKQKYSHIFKDKKLLSMIGEIIDSIETADEEDKDRVITMYGRKSGMVGIPIGNHLSQYSGNLYLSDFDHWVKEQKHVKYYFRYMDDIVIFGENKDYLWKLFWEIKEYMRSLRLVIKDNYQIFPSYVRGVDFVGYRIFGDYVLLRDRTKRKFQRKMKGISKSIGWYDRISYNEWCSASSYEGILKHCNSFGLRKRYLSYVSPYKEQFYEEHIRRKK